uniref:hypothetical protein n=1 Tax=Vibrio cidicii TaxID=1763883 RepID=UPI0037045832
MAHRVNDATLKPENYTTPGDATPQLQPPPPDLLRRPPLQHGVEHRGVLVEKCHAFSQMQPGCAMWLRVPH